MLGDLRLVEILSESLTDSRSFQVQVRDNAGVQELLKEREVQRSPLGSKRKNKFEVNLDTPDYILQPTLQAFSVSTRFEKLDVIAGMYDRIDTGNLQLHVRIIDLRGNVKFEDTARISAKFPRVEATEEQKRNATAPPTKPIRDAAILAAQGVVDSIVARVNPITVLAVHSSELVIDRGRNSGFDEKTIFGVYGPPKTGPHPNTGVMMWVGGEFIGQARVAALHEESTQLEMIKGDIAKVAVGSIVRINRKAAP